MTVIKSLFGRLFCGSWPESGPALPLTRDPDDERFFGRENVIVAICLFCLGLIFFGVI